MTKPSFAVVLSGCGVYDGAEIHEAVLTLLSIDRAGGTYQCFAPDADQMHVVNHLTGQPTSETRNILVESARIARGAIKSLTDYRPQDFDALVFPGGFGAAKNLCTLAVDGPDCKVNPHVQAAIQATHAAQKPIGALCIAPALLPRILGTGLVTIGTDQDTAGAIQAMGGTHRQALHGQVVIDPVNRLVTSPCYMLESTISQIEDGAKATINALFEMINA